MSTNNLKIFVLVVLIYLLSVSCNLSKTGKVQIHVHEKELLSDLDTIEVWCPYNYYCITWQVECENGQNLRISGSSMSEGNQLFGSFNIMNNYMNNNKLDVDSLNKRLQKMQVEKPYLILHRQYALPDSTWGTFKMFVLFTKNSELYGAKDKLIALSRSE